MKLMMARQTEELSTEHGRKSFGDSIRRLTSTDAACWEAKFIEEALRSWATQRLINSRKAQRSSSSRVFFVVKQAADAKCKTKSEVNFPSLIFLLENCAREANVYYARKQPHNVLCVGGCNVKAFALQTKALSEKFIRWETSTRLASQ